MHVNKLFLTFFMLGLARTDPIYLRCGDPNQRFTCGLLAKENGKPELNSLGIIPFKPDRHNDIWFINLRADEDPEKPKKSVEEILSFSRVDVNSLFNGRDEILKEVADCQKAAFSDNEKYAFSKFYYSGNWGDVKEGPVPEGMETHEYDGYNIVFCQVARSRILTLDKLSEMCYDRPVQQYSFRVKDVPDHPMGFFNFLFVSGCFKDGQVDPQNVGGFYFILQPGNPSYGQKDIVHMSHSKLDSQKWMNVPEDPLVAPPTGLELPPNAVGLFQGLEVIPDPQSEGNPTIPLLMFSKPRQNKKPLAAQPSVLSTQQSVPGLV